MPNNSKVDPDKAAEKAAREGRREGLQKSADKGTDKPVRKVSTDKVPIFTNPASEVAAVEWGRPPRPPRQLA